MNTVKRMFAILYLSQLANLEKKMRWVRFYLSLYCSGDYRAEVKLLETFQKQR